MPEQDHARAATTRKALVWFIPEKRGRMVTMHACWGADFAGETAVFPTKQEAIDFARKRWNVDCIVRGDSGSSPKVAGDV